MFFFLVYQGGSWICEESAYSCSLEGNRVTSSEGNCDIKEKVMQHYRGDEEVRERVCEWRGTDQTNNFWLHPI